MLNLAIYFSLRESAKLVLGVCVLIFAASTAYAQNQQIFTDGFESGDLSAWSKTKRPGSLDVNSSAARDGLFGLEVLSGRRRTGVLDKSPKREDDYLAEFFFDPNDIEILRKERVDILQLFGGPLGGPNVRLQLEQTSSNRFELRLLVRESSLAYRTVGKARVRRGESTRVSVLWVRAGTNGLDEGFAALFTNGIARGERDDLDNGAYVIETVRIGILKKPKAVTVGSYYLDTFESFRTLAP